MVVQSWVVYLFSFYNHINGRTSYSLRIYGLEFILSMNQVIVLFLMLLK